MREASEIASLLRQVTFVPFAPQRELQELACYLSTLVGERAHTVNRPQKTLEEANFESAAVVADVPRVVGHTVWRQPTICSLAKKSIANSVPTTRTSETVVL